jgi:hypothetical protein
MFFQFCFLLQNLVTFGGQKFKQIFFPKLFLYKNIFFQFCFLLQNLVTFWRQKLKEMRNFWKNKKKCFLGNFKILWKKFLLLMSLNSMYGIVRDRRCLNCTKTDQKISIMNTLNDNLTYNTSIPPKRFLALFNWKVPTFWFYMAILHVIHKSINCGSKYANLTQKLFKTSLKAF